LKQSKLIAFILTVSFLFSLLPNRLLPVTKAEEKNPLTIERVIGLSTVPGTFRKSQSIAVAKDGTIFIADTGESQIEVYDSKYKYLRSFGSIGTGDGQFQSIQKIALDSDENLYVLDRYTSIQVFNKEGKLLRKMGGTEDSIYPLEFAFLKTGELLILTLGTESRISHFKVYSKEGKYIRDFLTDKKYENENMFFTKLLVDFFGCVYVSIFNFDKNEEGFPIGNEYFKFNTDGSFACEFVKVGSEDKDLANDIGFMCTEGNLFYVSDGSLIKKFEISKDPKEPLQYREYFVIQSEEEDNALMIEYPSAGQYSQQKLYIMDPSWNRLVVLSPTHTVLGKIQSPIREEGRMYPKDKIPTEIFSNPQGITAGPDGNYYVANPNFNKISIFDSNWKEISSIGKPPESRNKELGELAGPIDVALDKQGNLFVLDSEEGTGSVEVFTKEKTPHLSIPIDMYNSGALAFNSNGNLVVLNDGSGLDIYDVSKLADKKASQIKTFPLGDYLFMLGDLVIDEDDNMIVSLTINMEIQWVSPKGKVIRKMKAIDGGGNPILFPKGMCIDGAGNIYVCEYFMGRIHKISPKGERIWTSDLGWKGLDYITMDAQGKLLVTDSNHNVVLQISDSTAIPPVPFVPKPIQTKAAFSLSPSVDPILEGDSFTVQVDVKKLESCSSMTLSIRYPEDLITLQSCELGDLLTGTDFKMAYSNAKPSTLDVALTSEGKIEKGGSGNLLTLTFQAKKPGTGKLSFETIAMKNTYDRDILFGAKTDLDIIILSKDTTPPILNVKPIPETVYESTLLIQGETEPDATLIINQKEVPIKTDGTFETVVELKLGENTIQITATDQAGNHSDVSLKVVLKEKIIIKLVIGSMEIMIKGVLGILDSEPFIDKKSGRTMVPLRAIAEAIGATVTFQAKEQRIDIMKNSVLVQLWIGKTKALVNGIEVEIDTQKLSPMIVKGRTFLPLRFVAETFEFKVDWDAKTQGITLTYPKG
jgi:DNA-binding beta-propeller fold protein YncE